MPYINQDARNDIDPALNQLIEHMQSLNASKGDVNYTITRIVLGVLKPAGGWRYESLSNAISVLRDAEHELRRRLLDPYEDFAIVNNFDVPEINSEGFRS